MIPKTQTDDTQLAPRTPDGAVSAEGEPLSAYEGWDAELGVFVLDGESKHVTFDAPPPDDAFPAAASAPHAGRALADDVQGPVKETR